MNDNDDRFDELASILDRGPSDVVDERPPEELWHQIRAEIQGNVQDEDDPDVVQLAGRTPRPRLVVLGVGLGVALLLVALPLALAYLSSESEPDRTAELAAVGSLDGGGHAELDGRTLRVDTADLGRRDGAVHELWLLDLDGGEVSDLVSLGEIEANGTFVVTDDVDLDRFTVVDISVEPNDGNPDHSGVSVLRGELGG